MIEKYKKSLVAPLDKGELHIFNSTSSLTKSINELLEIINKRAYGIYLIGGIRGSGKTSTINLCTAKYWRNDLIKITINCSRMIKIENFIYFFVEELYKQVKNLELSDEVLNEINSIKMKISNDVISKQINKNDILKKESQEREEIESKGQEYRQNILKIGIEFLKNILYKESKIKLQEESRSKNTIEEIQEKSDEFILINRLSKVMIEISKKKKDNGYSEYNIILIIDEIDKQNVEFIQELLDHYKNLFLNSNITIFFIVDTLNYMKINQGNELENKLLSYFTKSIYIPTMNFNYIKDYLYREFKVDNYKEIIITNYLTTGVFRKINTYNYLDKHEESTTFFKGYIYNLILNKSKCVQEKSYIGDIYKFFLKDIIEELFNKKCIYSSFIKKYIDNKKDNYYKYDFYELISNCFIEISEEEKCIKYIILPDKEIKYLLDEKEKNNLFYKYANEKIKYEFNKNEVYKINSYVNINMKQPKYIKISNNEPYAVYDIIRLIETLQSNVQNLYIVKKIVEYYGNEEYSYSAIVEVNKEIGNVMYAIEDFSFSYEDSWAIKMLKSFMKDNKIKLIEIEADDEPIENNVEYIREMLSEKINGGF